MPVLHVGRRALSSVPSGHAPLRNDHHSGLLHLHILLILRKNHWDRHVSNQRPKVPKKDTIQKIASASDPHNLPAQRSEEFEKTHPKPQPFRSGDGVDTRRHHGGGMAGEVHALSGLEAQ